MPQADSTASGNAARIMDVARFIPEHRWFGDAPVRTCRQTACLVRWVSATGEPGPWSETVTATVAA
ncbi:MAG: hypothetical protein AB7K52_13750 [Phycisphaerales bacterium]